MNANVTTRDIDDRINALNAYLPFPKGFGLNRSGSYGKTHIVLEQLDNGAEHDSVIRMATKREAYNALLNFDPESVLCAAWREFALINTPSEFTIGLVHGCIQESSGYYTRSLSLTSERFNIAYQRISTHELGTAIYAFWKLARIYTA